MTIPMLLTLVICCLAVGAVLGAAAVGFAQMRDTNES